ncbi:hypothetical protein BDQ17DRAFT_679577 [Cyathus striatus]|nr:hypothetical protein BDQ17DRAFT_679577 [Cyathus striatus]
MLSGRAKPANAKPSPSTLFKDVVTVLGTLLLLPAASGAKLSTSPLAQPLTAPPISSSIPSSPAASMSSLRGLERMRSRFTLDNSSPSPRNVLLPRIPLSGADTSSSSLSGVWAL